MILRSAIITLLHLAVMDLKSIRAYVKQGR